MPKLSNAMALELYNSAAGSFSFVSSSYGMKFTWLADKQLLIHAF